MRYIMAKIEKKPWSKKYEKCKTCGTTKGKHKSRGLCQPCYQKEQRIENARRRKENDTEARKQIGARPLEWTPERVAIESADLIEWSEDENNLVIEKFGLYRNPPYIREVMYKVGEQHAEFRSALLIAKERIRTRREEGAVVGTYNSSTFQFTHGFSDRDKNDTDISFTAYKDERKKVDDSADVNKQKQALLESKKFVEEAKAKIKQAKKEEIREQAKEEVKNEI